ncbi:MAG: DUF86 domain-containing protein [Gemmatimonadetes bacterium]|nr:DUF86 domain-containing protein [Gemmatimonadota bacterium]
MKTLDRSVGCTSDVLLTLYGSSSAVEKYIASIVNKWEIKNRLVHVYFSVDPRIVWNTIKDELPPLVPLLENLLPKEGEREEQEEQERE